MQLELEFTPEDRVRNLIKSRMRTLERYRRTSMAAHHRLVPSVRLYASAVETEVRAYGEQFPDSKGVQRSVAKFYEYANTHKLLST